MGTVTAVVIYDRRQVTVAQSKYCGNSALRPPPPQARQWALSAAIDQVVGPELRPGTSLIVKGGGGFEEREI
jgi:hypothetical protein